ncbi:sigma factor [Streptomyces malaysiensis]|uniref:sigma factor n=1 Tax=Streptomyces malaysiensis TaxID=92644 RepID=UPI0033DED286
MAAVYAATGDLAEAEDAVQEAYARAWQRWDRLTAEGDPTPWVRTVALGPYRRPAPRRQLLAPRP